MEVRITIQEAYEYWTCFYEFDSDRSESYYIGKIGKSFIIWNI